MQQHPRPADTPLFENKACMGDELPVSKAVAHTQHGVDNRIPPYESIHPELQVDMLYLFGQAFLLSISAPLGNLIMMTGVSSL